MIDDLHLLNSALGPIGPGVPTKSTPAAKAPSGPSFQEVLQQAADPKLKLSAHAQQRLQTRNIQLNSQDWDKINQAVDKAAQKGSREALVLSDKAALVVSVKNRTVITAVDPDHLKENVFTNIDSAVIV